MDQRRINEGGVQGSNLPDGPHPLSVRRFCAEYPNDKKAANIGRPLAILQSTYFSQELSKNLSVSLQHLSWAAPSSARPAAPSSGAPVSDELTINQYDPCDTFDLRKETKLR
jgi:hypothetical protein